MPAPPHRPSLNKPAPAPAPRWRSTSRSPASWSSYTTPVHTSVARRALAVISGTAHSTAPCGRARCCSARPQMTSRTWSPSLRARRWAALTEPCTSRGRIRLRSPTRRCSTKSLASPPSAPEPPTGAPVTLDAYLDALAAAVPTPGGGSATGLAGALGAALVCMVGNYTVGRPKYADVEDEVRAALDEANELRAKLMALAEADERAYKTVAAARKLPRASEGERMLRNDEIQRATRAAAQPPLEMAAACRRALELADVVARHGNASLASDAGVAALFSEAALRASAINV